MMKIDSVRKDDEHKVLIRTQDDDGGVILISLSADENGLGLTILDSNIKHLTRIRVAVGNSEYTTHVPLVEYS